MRSDRDTIAAIATAPGESAIAIVRIAGPAALALADRIVRCPGQKPSQRPAGEFFHAYAGPPEDPHGAPAPASSPFDEVIVLVYRAPHSYTSEDAIEIQCHGGSVSARRIMGAAVQAGARPADPGEFTLRAFFNGRIDLVQAEAVADMIRARSDRAADAAMEQLSGRLSLAINGVYEAVLSACADIEAALDFPEDDVPVDVVPIVSPNLRLTLDDLNKIAAKWREGHVLREGVRIVIYGKPNVGKSTLFNSMIGTARAIVHHRPGTTRDVLEENMVIEGVPVRLVDTAGMHDTDCEVEQEGIRRAMDSLERADLSILVVDGSRPLDADDFMAIASADPAKCLLIASKSDVSNDPNTLSIKDLRILHLDLKAPKTRDLVLQELSKLLPSCLDRETTSIVSERHYSLLATGRDQLTVAYRLLDHADPDLALVASELHAVLESLGRITGRVHDSELLTQIFSRYCIGK